MVHIAQELDLTDLVPRQNEMSFVDWWHNTIRRVKKEHKKGVNTLIMLDAWIIWKYRNACVFKEASPWVNTILCELKDRSTAYIWCMVSAKKLYGLGLTFAI